MKNINIIDIEASGLHFDSYPIEVAVIVNGQSKSWLIKPEANWLYWCTTAESMHGITRNKLLEEGVSAKQVADELLVFLEGSNGILYSDAAHWDSDWLDTLFFAANSVRSFHIASIYDLLKRREAHFDKAKAQLAASGKYRHHRAEEDVWMIYEAYLEAGA